MRILLTGSTGMIGKGVLLECIKSPRVKSITLINRSPVDIRDRRVTEIILPDFLKLESIKDQFSGIDACFHCMGVSALGLKEEHYSRFTFDITVKLADLCYALNPEMSFIYVSGAGTDSSENGRQMWARVKGKTENYVLSKGFGKTLMFRPGLIIPEDGIRSRTKLYQRIYNIMKPFYPLFKKMKGITTTSRIGKAMIQSVIDPGIEMVYMKNKEINDMAAQL